MATKNDVHPLLQRAKDVAAMVPYWDQVDAIVEGYDAIKNGGEMFLPKFPNETDKKYKFRLECSKFTNIYRDVLEGLATKPFEEEISLLGGDETPEQFTNFIEDVDGAGNNLSMFSALTFFNGINSAIDWIFVDYPSIETGVVLSRKEAKDKGIKPYWSHVLARNIYEIRTAMIGGVETLSYIRIFEPANDTNSVDHVRVFERSTDSVVTWTLYKKVPDSKTIEGQFVVEKNGVMSINVIPLVPFATGRRDGRTFKFFPVMRDAADLQLKLYQNESALEFVKILACYPMLAANGMKPAMAADGKSPLELAVGPMQVLYGLPDGNGGHGTWNYIEPNANSMEFMQKNIAQTKQDLRELGRQPLTALSSQLTTVTTSIAAGKARSAVTAWALGLKDALENALVITGMYMKVAWEPEVNVYTGFDNVTDDGSDLDALATARQNGDLSMETYHVELKRRKVLSPEFKHDDEMQRLLNEIPVQDVSNIDPAPPKSKNDAKTT